MRAQDIRAMTDEELEAAIENTRQELFNLRFQWAVGRLADTSRLKAVRRDLARLFTVRRERQLWAEYQAAQEEE